MLAVAVNAAAFYLGAICLQRFGMAAGIAVFIGTGFPGTVICSFVEHQLTEFMLTRWGGRPMLLHAEADLIAFLHRSASTTVSYAGPDPSDAGSAEKFSTDPDRR
jgi:hypothetical protein